MSSVCHRVKLHFAYSTDTTHPAPLYCNAKNTAAMTDTTPAKADTVAVAAPEEPDLEKFGFFIFGT